MKITRLLYMFLLVSISQIGIAQSSVLFEDSFTEITSEQEKFSIYLDSIGKYLYGDIDLTNKALEECQKIVEQGTMLSDSIFFEFVIFQIYLEYSKSNPLGAYQKIIDNEDIADNINLTRNQIGNFNYLKCFTLHSIGDLESAQKEYYTSIEKGKVDRDTNAIVRNMYSLGQLYSDEGEYDSAIKCFQQVHDYSLIFTIRTTTSVLNDLELAEAYYKFKKYDEAQRVLERAEVVTNRDELNILKSDILMIRGNIYLEEGNIAAAEGIYKELVAVNKSTQDQNNLFNTQRFLGDLYYTKKMYSKTLDIHKEMLKSTDSTNLDLQIAILKVLYEVSEKTNDFEGAYSYLLDYNKVNNKKNADEKRQKTAYLKIKFDSEQKEKDNAVLSAELVKNQAERNFLYALIAWASLFLALLFGAFYQKSRYNKKLEAEVERRTVTLKKSNHMLNEKNNELDEFNRILSHDLKEPLRSIVSFSQLASRNISSTEKAKEYLDIVTESGEQLHRLINDVNLFQNTNSISLEENSSIDIQTLLDGVVNQIQLEYPDKEINLVSAVNPVILGAPEILKSVFWNLIDNAVKYNEQENVSINVNYELRGNRHYFELEDNGIGIAPEYHNRIFEMFKRLNVRNVYTGSGLGLSIVKKMVERLGGEISLLRSQENVGSTFMFNFPEKLT